MIKVRVKDSYQVLVVAVAHLTALIKHEVTVVIPSHLTSLHRAMMAL